MSRVDVIIPCYRYGHYLRSCVRSVLDQKGVDVRALVIDDASPDETPEVAATLANEDSRVEYRRHAANRGHIATYNEGLDWATGDYTLLLSADDLLVPGALARAASLMDAHPEVVMTFGPWVCFHRNDELPEVPACGAGDPWRVLRGADFVEASCASLRNFVPTCTAVVRTLTQRQIGGYRPELPHTGDMEMWLRFAAYGSIGESRVCQGLYRQHERNMSRQFQSVVDMRHKWCALDSFLRHCRDRIADAERLQRLAGKNMAESAFWNAFLMFEKGDSAECRGFLLFAEEIFPEVRSWPSWSRMRWKRLIGPRLWSVVRPALDRLRGCKPSRSPA